MIVFRVFPLASLEGKKRVGLVLLSTKIPFELSGAPRRNPTASCRLIGVPGAIHNIVNHLGKCCKHNFFLIALCRSSPGNANGAGAFGGLCRRRVGVCGLPLTLTHLFLSC